MASQHKTNQDDHPSAGHGRRMMENGDTNTIYALNSNASHIRNSHLGVRFTANVVDAAAYDLEAFFAKCCQCPNVISLFGKRAFKCDCGHVQCQHCLVYSVEVDRDALGRESV